MIMQCIPLCNAAVGKLNNIEGNHLVVTELREAKLLDNSLQTFFKLGARAIKEIYLPHVAILSNQQAKERISVHRVLRRKPMTLIAVIEFVLSLGELRLALRLKRLVTGPSSRYQCTLRVD